MSLRQWWSCTLLLAVLPAALTAQVITTVAGTDFIFPVTPIRGLDAPLGTLSSTSVDLPGNVYVVDRDNCIALRVAPDGTTTVIAGNGLCVFSGDGGPAVNAGLLNPFYGALDSDGNFYIRESGRIRKVDRGGRIQTVAGTGFFSGNMPSGDGGPATSAVITSFGPFVITPAGEIVISEAQAHRIRRVDRAGLVTTIAGTGAPGFTGDGGPAAAAQLSNPEALAIDAAGDLFIGDRANGRIRKVTRDGIISTIGMASADSLAIDGSGAVLYSGLATPQIFRLSAGGQATPIAGNGVVGFGGDNGPALQAQFRINLSFAADTQGNLFIADAMNFRVRKVDSRGVVTTIAGNGNARFTGEGTAALSTPLADPAGLALDAAGNLYIGENSGNRVRKMAQGLLTTFAGTGASSFRGSNGDGGAATEAAVATPLGLAIDHAGNVYITERNATSIRKVTPDGIISSLPRPPVPWGPAGLAFDRQGVLFITDEQRDGVYRFDGTGTPQRIAGTGVRGNSGDGGAATSATFNSPSGIAVDASGNVYVADTGNRSIRKIGADGNISTFVPASSLTFPRGLTIDSAGNLYVADTFFIRRITPGGTLSTVAGTGPGTSGGDGKLATQAVVANAENVVLEASGNVFFTERRSNGRVRAILAAQPTFSISPTALNFQAPSGGAPADAQTLIATGSITGIEFSISIDTRGSGNWLSVTPSTGGTPRLIEVAADPASLAPGSYTAAITIRSPNAIPASTIVGVTFSVAAALPPRLALDRANLSFPFPQGGSARSQTLKVSNAGGGRLDFTAAVSGSVFSVNAASGAATPGKPAALAIIADPRGLGPGLYTSVLTITAGSDTRRIPLTMTVSANPRAILLSQTGLSFVAVEKGGVVPPQSFAVLNIGSTDTTFAISSTTLSGGSAWLKTSASGGITVPDQPPPTVAVSVDATGLAPGVYYGQVRVNAPEAANSPQVATIYLEVLPQGSDPGASIQPTELVFTTSVGGASPGSQDLLIYDAGEEPKRFQTSRAAESGVLLPAQVLPESGTIAGKTPARIVVQPLTQTFNTTPGAHTQTLTFQFSDGRVRPVKITIIVAPRGSSAAKVRGVDPSCVPGELVPAVTSLGPSFSVSAGWPVSIVAEVRDNCGNPLTAGSVGVGFSNGDPPLRLNSLRNGQWAGTWQAGRGNGVTLTLTATDASERLSGKRQISGGFRTQQDPPVFDRAAVVSGAAPQSFAPLAPGGIITIFGSRLADGLSQTITLPLPTELANAQVIVGGQSAPMFFASDGQLNAVVPFGVNPNTTQQVVVQRGPTYSQPIPVDVGPAQPGIFSTAGRAIAFAFRGAAAGFAVTTQTPAAAGDVVVLYAAGLGATDPPVADGAASPSAPLAATLNPATVSIGGADAPLLFSGLVPGFVGLYQVNARVPPGAATGDSVPVTITVAGQTSPPALISVR